jgi:hypothetical protein
LINHVPLPDATQLLPYAVGCLAARHAAIAAAAAVGPLAPTLDRLYWTKKKWLGLLSGQLAMAMGASVAALIDPHGAAPGSSALAAEPGRGAAFASVLQLSLALGFVHFLLIKGAGSGGLAVRPAAYVAVAAAAVPLALLHFHTLGPALPGA